MGTFIPAVPVAALSAEEGVSFQSAVVGRANAERDASFIVRFREVLDDPHVGRHHVARRRAVTALAPRRPLEARLRALRLPWP